MLNAVRHRLFTRFADWAIARAMRKPYFHLFHDDGRPYMQRFWLVRIGMPKGWRQLEIDAGALEARAIEHERLFGREAAAGRWVDVIKARGKIYPRFGIRIHRIMSSDDRVFHDHPWHFTTLILRGGYTEFTPSGFNPGDVTVTTDYDGAEPLSYTNFCAVRYNAGQVLRRKATAWHYLQLAAGEEAWTMFCVGRKRQRWGFLVDGLMKVPYDIYLRARRNESQRGA